jgi:hypothetical protein
MPVKSLGGQNFILRDRNLRDLCGSAFVFPDDLPTKILRRGTLSCFKDSGDCRFVMQLPQDVQSIN